MSENRSYCASEYILPDPTVYKTRSTYFHLPPRLPAPPKWTPAPHRDPPPWAERLSMLTVKNAEFATEKALKRVSLSRSRSHTGLSRPPGSAGKLGATMHAASHPALVASKEDDEEVSAANTQGGEEGDSGPPLFTLLIEVEHCTVPRPTALLQGSNQNYLDALQRLEAAIAEMSPVVRCEYKVRVNPLLKSAKVPASLSPTAMLMAQRQSAGQLLVPSSTKDHRAPPSMPLTSNYPRIGAFEVSYVLQDRNNGVLLDSGALYSKLATRQWPNTSALVEVLKQAVHRARFPPPPKPTPAAPPPRPSPTVRRTTSPAPLQKSESFVKYQNKGRNHSAEVLAVLDAISSTELQKALKAAGLPEGRSKEEMVNALATKLVPRRVASSPSLLEGKKRRKAPKPTRSPQP